MKLVILKKFILLAPILILIFLYARETFAENVSNSSITEKKLEFSIKLEKTKYKFDGIGKINIELKNAGESPLYIFKNKRWDVYSSMRFIILDKDDERILFHENLVSSIPPPPPLEGFSEKHLTRLDIKQTITSSYWLDIASTGIKESGNYKLVTYFQGIYSQEYMPKSLDIWTSENGQVKSNAVTFTVTK